MEKNNKNGVAVIIVLGLLALLMVLGVTFGVTMRVERAGAANYATAVKNRQMLWAGLARAIGDINNTIGDDMYPTNKFLVSGGDWGSEAVGGVKLLKFGVTNEVPGGLASLVDKTSAWKSLGGSGDDREGYYAYAVLNLSDMLDLHQSGGAARSGGMDASELVLATNLLTAAETNILVNARTADGPFETLAEFRAYYGQDIRTEYFVDYSRYLQDMNRTGSVYMGTSVGDLTANKVEILTAMHTMLGADPTRPFRQKDVWFDYLLDYVDTNMAPRRLNGPNAKPVPLLNEVAPSGAPGRRPNLSLSGLSGQILVEVWNPSVKQQGQVYVKILGNMTSTVAITNHSGVVVGPFTNTVAIASTRFLSPDRDDFAVSPFSITHNWPPVDPATTNTVGVSIAITNLTVILDADGTILDSATNVVLRFNYAGPYIAGALSLTPESWQTIDPRCNWHQRGWTNAPATFSPDWRRGLHNAGQAGKRVYTSEKGVLYSPLELGHLLCLGGQTVPGVVETEWVPWREFKVYGSGRHKLMEHFTTLVPGVRKGLVNANSEDTNLLKLVFEQLPVPTPPMAGAAADYVVAQNRADKFKNVSDMLDSEWQTDLVSAGLDNDVKADLLLAYSTGLLGVRQNLFLVVVAASGASQGMGSGGSAGVAEVDTRNSKRAMAVVWRDPVKNSVGQYDCFVRMFKWLD